jgi:hypothetical protein
MSPMVFDFGIPGGPISRGDNCCFRIQISQGNS